MHGPINLKSPNITGKGQMGFNLAFKGLIILCTYNVILRWIPVTIFTVEKQYLLRILSICFCLDSPALKTRVPYYIFFSGLSSCPFFNITLGRQDFLKQKRIYIKCVF